MTLSDQANEGLYSIIVGVIMAVIGVIILVVNPNTIEIPWYVWVLIIGGILLGIFGGVKLANNIEYDEKSY